MGSGLAEGSSLHSDRPFEAGGQQIENAPYMVGMHMGDGQGANTLEPKLDLLVVSPCAVRGGIIGPLDLPSVEKDAAVMRHVQLMTGTGYDVVAP